MSISLQLYALIPRSILKRFSIENSLKILAIFTNSMLHSSSATNNGQGSAMQKV